MDWTGFILGMISGSSLTMGIFFIVIVIIFHYDNSD